MTLTLHKRGDEYRAYGDQIAIIASILHAPITHRNCQRYVSIPAHDLDVALSKLVKARHRVEVCEPTN